MDKLRLLRLIEALSLGEDSLVEELIKETATSKMSKLLHEEEDIFDIRGNNVYVKGKEVGEVDIGVASEDIHFTGRDGEERTFDNSEDFYRYLSTLTEDRKYDDWPDGPPKTEEVELEDIIFFQPDTEEAERYLRMVKEQGEDAVIDELKQRHYPGEHGTYTGLRRGKSGALDEIYEKDGYVLTYNMGQGYIGLSYVVDELDKLDENREFKGFTGYTKNDPRRKQHLDKIKDNPTSHEHGHDDKSGYVYKKHKKKNFGNLPDDKKHDLTSLLHKDSRMENPTVHNHGFDDETGYTDKRLKPRDRGALPDDKKHDLSNHHKDKLKDNPTSHEHGHDDPSGYKRV